MIDEILSQTLFIVFGFTLTGWKIIGLVGTLMFGGRWFVQAAASKKAGRPTIPRLFWYMSLAGSLMTLLYFIFGKNDSVGILSNIFPSAVAFYNLYLDVTHRRKTMDNG